MYWPLLGGFISLVLLTIAIGRALETSDDRSTGGAHASAAGRPSEQARYLRPKFATTGHPVRGQVTGDSDSGTLTLTLAVFWNAGRTPIRSEDVELDNPIRFVVSGRIVNVALAAASGEGIALETTPTEVVLRFERLDRQEGVGVAITHDGKSDEAVLAGAIKNAEGKLRSGTPREAALLALPLAAGLAEILHAVLGEAGVNEDALFWLFIASLGVPALYVLLNYLDVQEMTERSEYGRLWVQRVPEYLRYGTATYNKPEDIWGRTPPRAPKSGRGVS